MAENSNQEEAAVTQLGGGGGGVWVKPLHIHGNFVWEVGGEGGIHAQRGYILNLGVSISVSS
jgi:hypothetical protein